MCSVKLSATYCYPHPLVFNACFGHFENTFPRVTSIQVTIPYQYAVFNNDFNKYNWKQWRSRTSFRIVICFRDIRIMRTFVCEPFLSLKSTKMFCLQYSLRYASTIETLVIELGLFISSSCISGLTMFGLGNHFDTHEHLEYT